MLAMAGLRQKWGRGASQGEGVGGWEVGCQECGSRSALLCVLCERNRATAGWDSSQLQFPIDFCVQKA